MTKQECKKLASSIIDYLCGLAGDIRRSDITLCVQDDDIDDSNQLATTESNHLYDTPIIRLYLDPHMSAKDYIPAICHEVAHVLTAGYASYFDRFVGVQDGDEELSASFNTFRQTEERVAMRLGDIFTELWRLKNKGKGK